MRYKTPEKLLLVVVLLSLTASHIRGTEQANFSCTAECSCSWRYSEKYKETFKLFDCSFGSMKEFPVNFPSDVESLDLHGNSIFTLAKSLSQLTNLKELDLAANRLKSIGRSRMFQNLTQLLYLNVGKNSISTIFHDNLKGPDKLHDLVLSHNKINYIEDEAFENLHSLQSLDLEHNILGSLYSEWFVGLKNLISLNLSHNRVHNIPAAVFRPLQILDELYLTGNRISTIDPRAFSGLNRLRILHLDNNLITRIPTAAFQSIPVLELLGLDNNPLEKVKPLDFSHLSVSTLSLCKMPELRIVSAKGFYNLINLTDLALKDNKNLAYVDPLAFMNVDRLKKLQLQHNNIQGIQPQIGKYLPNGIEISLFENPLLCDCNLRWLRKAIDNANSSIIVAESEHLVCNAPKDLKYKLLRDVDISKISKSCKPTIVNLTLAEEIIGKVGERKGLECRALGYPTPSISWILPDGSFINSSLNEVRVRFFFPGTLVYYHLKPTDAGIYTCLAQNSVGTEASYVNLTVTGIDIHLFPVATSSTFVTLVWNGTERKLFPQYKIIYNRYIKENKTDIGDEYFSIASQSRKRFTIGRLVPETTYKFCLGYEDQSGYWLKISCCIATTQDAGFMMRGISKTHNFSIIIIVTILLIMLIFIACLMSLGSRKYKQRLYECPDKSGSIGGSSPDEGSLQIPLNNLYKPLLKRS